ncbi:hypothetical protein KFZ58_05550 [Virgibacillus sp. NKC19-16]|uniref:hypothetical protein n=1 Tax=Virgibacillus salidurans TaxID=2831673 RepID=UPI001F3FDBC5|nr:hypothetical protein [Virgibacillus sp. NKC19-16]UJL47357.1 hypothetical protein KFZ58_05550 [Virgibacillus sp. NKC19-16]
MLRVLLELLRIIFIFLLLGGLLWILIGNFYQFDDVENYQWFPVVGIYILLFVLYRNRLQFSGWYVGKGRMKLSAKVSKMLIGIAVLFLVVPFVIHAINLNL